MKPHALNYDRYATLPPNYLLHQVVVESEGPNQVASSLLQARITYMRVHDGGKESYAISRNQQLVCLVTRENGQDTTTSLQ